MGTHQPKIIVITGRPAAGKTTLARWLAQELKLPFVSKDSIREVLFDRLGWKDRAWARLLGQAGVDLMFYFAQMQLEVGRSLILDNSFDPVVSVPRFQSLKTHYEADIVQIICNSDQETLFQRFKARASSGNRHPGHGDEAVFDELRINLAKERSPILDIEGAIIQIDTTDFKQIDYHTLLNQVKLLMEGQKGLL